MVTTVYLMNISLNLKNICCLSYIDFLIVYYKQVSFLNHGLLLLLCLFLKREKNLILIIIEESALLATCKLFTSVLNNRLITWSDENNVITDAQFGFKSKCGTSDAIFALHTLITSSLANNKKHYYAFIDFKKAFDSVDRSTLWMKLSKIGIQGKLLRVIKGLYKNVKACVTSDGHLSDFFYSNLGLMQGEVLSPILFNLYVNDFEINFLNSECVPFVPFPSYVC